MAAENDVWKRYLDAGVAFTQMTRERAEEFVKELVKAGELQRERSGERIDELVERSRKNTEELLGYIRKEVATQLKALGLEDLARRTGIAGTKPVAKKGAPSTSAANKSGPAKKAPAKAASASSTATSKATAKKVPTAKKSPAAKKPSPAKKASSAKKA